MHYYGATFLLYTFIGLNIVNIILPIIFAIKTSKGKIESMYPVIIRLIK